MSAHRGNDINLILASADKRVRETSGLLSRLWRNMLIELGITGYKFNIFLANYLDKLSEGQSMSQDRITNERNNLRKGLADPDMTFDMFVRGLQLYAPREAHFEVELIFDNEERILSKINVGDECEGGLGKLSYLYRDLLTQLGKDVNSLEKEIDQYLSNPLLRENTGGRQRGNDKGNLRRELPGENITWEVFRKGLRILDQQETILRVYMRWNRSRVTQHILRIPTPKKVN